MCSTTRRLTSAKLLGRLRLSDFDGNQVEDAQAHEAQAQQGVQAQRITRSMARALGQEYQKMALLISFVE